MMEAQATTSPGATCVAYLKTSISTKRSRIDELKSELEAESIALVKLEKMLASAKTKNGLFSLENITAMLKRKNLRPIETLSELCGATIVGTLSCVSQEIKLNSFTT